VIALVTGKLAAKDHGGSVVVNTGSVGYRIFISLNTFLELPEVGEDLSLFTVTVVREDSFHLYGFMQTEERDLFNLLVQVKGVGPKVALALLGGIKPADLKKAISREDAGWISTVPGVGRKTAERIVLELKDKVSVASDELPSHTTGVDEQAVSDVVSALSNLGYRSVDGRKAVQTVLQGIDRPESFEYMIRESLKILSGRKR
jgi:Holliday junction DNA helicase RuvA